MLSVLNLSAPVGEIPEGVFSDASLDKLLSKKEISVMSHICAPNDILSRQEIFKLLEDKAFYDWLHGLYLNLKYLEKSKLLFENSAHGIERCALFIGYAKSYISTVESMKSSYKIPILRALNEDADLREEHRVRLFDGINKYKALWEKTVKCRIIFEPSGVYVKNPEDEETQVCERVYKICERLGYGSERENIRSGMKISPRLADALIGLRKDEFMRMKILREELLPLINPDILPLAEELEFYFSINRLRERAKSCGADICYPEISSAPGYRARDLYDISLLLKDGAKIVPNDIEMTEGERAFFICGANGGGKTTFLRAAAVNLIMFLSGCPVYAKSAEIYPFTRIFTHFPENEGFASGGRLENEVNRLSEVLKCADGKSFILLNETFSGADEKKGTELSIKLMTEISRKKAFALFVTHFHGVSESDFPSLTTVVSGNENIRTFKIVKQLCGRSSYALDILKKYGMDREGLEKRRGGGDEGACAAFAPNGL